MTDTNISSLPVSRAEGRQLCGVFILTLDDGAPISTGTLADHLGLSGATVTESIKRLNETKLVSYEPYAGVELTARGEKFARRLLWRRCLIQEFFETTAGVSLDSMTAYRIGRTVSTRELSQLEETLTRPCRGQCKVSDQSECDRLSG